MAAITVTVQNTAEYTSSRKIVFGTITLSSNYQAGGDSFTLSQFGMEGLDYLDLGTATNATPLALLLNAVYPNATGGSAAGNIESFTPSNTNTLQQVANSTNLAGYSAAFMAIGW